MTPTALRKKINKAIRELEAMDNELRSMVFEPKQLVGVQEAAEILGITPNALATRKSRGKFPEPVVVLSGAPIWHREDIEALQ